MKSDKSIAAHLPLLSQSLGAKLGTLIISALSLAFICGAMMAQWGNGSDSRNQFLLWAVAQNVLIFMLPSFITAWLCSPSPGRYLAVASRPRVSQILAILIIFILITPALNVIIDWNQNASLPDAVARFEPTLRQWEESAAKTTQMVLADASVWGLISGLLVVGLITGLAEEAFFRAGIQRALTSSGINQNVAIIITAFIFSALHFQFFGFVPRFLLGALFGYLYFKSDSLWVAASAHALNNSIVVVAAWIEARYGYAIAPDSIGLSENGPVAWVFFTSAALSSLFLFFIAPKMLQNNGSSK